MPSTASVDVGVVEHDDRRLAAELEVHALEVVGRGLRDLHARAHRAGDRDHLRGRVVDHRGAGRAVARDDVEHARRQELGGDLGEQQRRRAASCRSASARWCCPRRCAGANFHTAMLSG